MDLGGHRDRNASHGRVKQNWERGTLPASKGGRGKSPQIEFLSERNSSTLLPSVLLSPVHVTEGK